MNDYNGFEMIIVDVSSFYYRRINFNDQDVFSYIVSRQTVASTLPRGHIRECVNPLYVPDHVDTFGHRRCLPFTISKARRVMSNVVIVSGTNIRRDNIS